MFIDNSIKNHSNPISLYNDSLKILFDTLAFYNFYTDTSFHLKSDTYLTNIINMIMEGQKMDLNACECVDSVKIFKFKKNDFDHRENGEYFSFPIGDYDTEIWVKIWYFANKQKAIKCIDNNNRAFTQNDLNVLPQKTFVIDEKILSISPASLKETELYKEFINIICEAVDKVEYQFSK